MRASQGTFFEFLIRRIIKLNKTSMASSGQEKNMCVSGYIFKKIRVGRKLLTSFFQILFSQFLIRNTTDVLFAQSTCI